MLGRCLGFVYFVSFVSFVVVSGGSSFFVLRSWFVVRGSRICQNSGGAKWQGSSFVVFLTRPALPTAHCPLPTSYLSAINLSAYRPPPWFVVRGSTQVRAYSALLVYSFNPLECVLMWDSSDCHRTGKCLFYLAKKLDARGSSELVIGMVGYWNTGVLWFCRSFLPTDLPSHRRTDFRPKAPFRPGNWRWRSDQATRPTGPQLWLR